MAPIAIDKSLGAARLTSPVIVETDVPFPKVSSKKLDDEEYYVTTFEYTAGQHIQIKACSELIDQHVPLQVFNAGPEANLKLLHGPAGHPIIFTIGNDHQLYCLFYLNGTTEGWELSKLSLSDKSEGPTPAFLSLDCVESPQGLACICVATAKSVHYASFNLEDANFDAAEHSAPFHPSDIQWQRAPTLELKDSDARISDISCGLMPTGFQILAGTKSQTTAASFVLYTAQSGQQWKYVPRAESAVEVIDNLPAAFHPSWTGIFTLYKTIEGRGTCSATILSPESGERLFNYRILTSRIGDASQIFSMTTPWRTTDLFVAASKGIGHFDSRRMDQLPTVFHAGVAFKQVVAAEQVQSASSSRISVFAIDTREQMYSIQGIRKFHGNKIEWSFSPYPIRHKCSTMSSQYNLKSNIDEVLYVSSDGFHINHLMRDATGEWSEDAVRYKVPSTLPQTVTYVSSATTISLQNAKGERVPEGYPVWVAATSTTYATLNGVSVILRPESDEFFTNDRGQIQILAKAPDDLRMGVYQIELGGDDVVSNIYDVDPMQRAWTIMKTLKTGNDIRSAKSTTGELVFDQSESKKAQYDAAASVIRNHVDTPLSTSFSWSTSDHGGSFKVSSNESQDQSFIEKVRDATSKVFSDVLEAVERGFVAVYRAGVCVVNGALNLFIEVGETIWSVVVSTAHRAVSFVATFLKHYLGLDLEKMWKLFKYSFDQKTITRTQKELVIPQIEELFDNAPKVLQKASGSIDSALQKVEEKVEAIFDVKPPTPSSHESGYLSKLIEAVLDNPIVQYILGFNPVRIITDFLFGNIEFKVSIPDFTRFAGDIESFLVDAVDEGVNDIFEVLHKLGDETVDFFLSPSVEALGALPKHTLGNLVLAVIHFAKKVSGKAMDTVTTLMSHAKELFAEEWTVPYLTELWKSFSGQPFSLLNYGSYNIAALYNLLYLAIEGVLPFESHSGNRMLESTGGSSEKAVVILDLIRDICRVLSGILEVVIILSEKKKIWREDRKVIPLGSEPPVVSVDSTPPSNPTGNVSSITVTRKKGTKTSKVTPVLGTVVVENLEEMPLPVNNGTGNNNSWQKSDIRPTKVVSAPVGAASPYGQPWIHSDKFDWLEVFSVGLSFVSISVECSSVGLRSKNELELGGCEWVSLGFSGLSMLVKLYQMRRIKEKVYEHRQMEKKKREKWDHVSRVLECTGTLVVNTREMVDLRKRPFTLEGGLTMDGKRYIIDGLSTAGCVCSLISVPCIMSKAVKPTFYLRGIDAALVTTGSIMGLVVCWGK